jgi:hypothetical protein
MGNGLIQKQLNENTVDNIEFRTGKKKNGDWYRRK